MGHARAWVGGRTVVTAGVGRAWGLREWACHVAIHWSLEMRPPLLSPPLRPKQGPLGRHRAPGGRGRGGGRGWAGWGGGDRPRRECIGLGQWTTNSAQLSSFAPWKKRTLALTGGAPMPPQSGHWTHAPHTHTQGRTSSSSSSRRSSHRQRPFPLRLQALVGKQASSAKNTPSLLGVPRPLRPLGK